MATNKLFHITAITNLHVGSGTENIGVVDNLIQRDVITKLPIIHSSSLKGALREHCNCNKDQNVIDYIFGSEIEMHLRLGTIVSLMLIYWHYLCEAIKFLT